MRAARVVTRRRWTAPVPEMVWKEVTRFSLIAGLSPPRMSFCDAEVNFARPAIGRYSWLRSGSEWRHRGSELWRCAAAVGTLRYGDLELWRRCLKSSSVLLVVVGISSFRSSRLLVSET